MKRRRFLQQSAAVAASAMSVQWLSGLCAFDDE
jgi:hypothetical protein